MFQRSLLKLTLVAAATSVALTAPASAQKPFEFGVDAGLELQGNGTDLDVVTVSLPASFLRAARHLSPHVSLESTGSLSYMSFPDQTSSPSATSLGVSLAVLYHVGDDRARPRLHGLLGIPLRHVRASDDTGSFSDTELGLLGAVGATLPVDDRLAARVQLRGIGWDGSRTSLSFLLGLSMLTR